MQRKPIILFKYIIITVILLACQAASEKKKNINIFDPDLHQGDFQFRKLSDAEEAYYNFAARDYYEKLLIKSNFNGSILIAKNGQIIFEDYRGLHDFKFRDSINPQTPFHLASISKTFTGMMTLKLWEEGRISLNDSIQKFFPALPYKGITIRMLLSHRSGLPNYLYFLDKGWDRRKKATNEDVINYMEINKPPVMSQPGRAFHYCNTNFMLLASIIEKITGKPYPQYMKDSLFTPLDMNSTFVFTINDTANYIPTYSVSKPFPMDHLDCTYGDKNIYSTVRDLLQWDKSLYQHTFLTKATLDSAFTPQSHERNSMHNYGLGWRLFNNQTDSIIYHNGKWHGTNTAFTRLVKDTATIIVLGNKVNRNIYKSKEISIIFTGQKDTATLAE